MWQHGALPQPLRWSRFNPGWFCPSVTSDEEVGLIFKTERRGSTRCCRLSRLLMMLAVSKEILVVIAEAQGERGCVGRLTAPHLRNWHRMGWRRALPQPLESFGLRRRLVATGEDKVIVLIFSANRRGGTRRHLGARLLVTLFGGELVTVFVFVVEAQGERRRVGGRGTPRLLFPAASHGGAGLLLDVVVEVDP